MKEEEVPSSITSGSCEAKKPRLVFVSVETKHSNVNSKPGAKISVKQENVLLNKGDSKPSHSGSISWPSLWKNGPRRSAFQPYKPRRDVRVAEGTQPRPASTTVMTNLQRGNMQADPTPTPSNMSWFTLAGRGDVTSEQIQEMIAQGKDLDCVDEEGLSGLMWAAFHGQIRTVQSLLEAGQTLEVDREGMWGETALMLAATEGHLEIVRLLISAGANVNHEDHSHSTPLICAVLGDHPHTVSELLSNGADMWVHNSDNLTAYDIAIDHKSLRSKIVLEKYISSLITGT